MLAPPKMALLVSMFLPVRWTKHDAGVDAHGRKLCAALESELNCLSTRTLRSLTNLAKAHLKSVKMDLGIVIDTPVDQEEKEVQACAGMCTFSHVDVVRCPTLPNR